MDPALSLALDEYLDARERFLRKAAREVRRSAYHEAGHAVAAIVRRIDFDWVAVQPLSPEWESLIDGDLFDPFATGTVRGRFEISYHQAEHVWADHLVYTLAGPVAEARFAGLSRIHVGGGETGDRGMVDKLLRCSRLHDHRSVESDYRTLARLLVDEHWPKIEAVALALIERRYLSAKDVRRIIRDIKPID